MLFVQVANSLIFYSPFLLGVVLTKKVVYLIDCIPIMLTDWVWYWTGGCTPWTNRCTRTSNNRCWWSTWSPSSGRQTWSKWWGSCRRTRRTAGWSPSSKDDTNSGTLWNLDHRFWSISVYGGCVEGSIFVLRSLENYIAWRIKNYAI